MAEYACIPLTQVYELDVFSFWTLLHDAVVYNNSQTKEGRQWLHNAWRLTRVAPEDSKLKQKYGRGG